MDVYHAVQNMRAGQPFEAVLERDGGQVVARGRLGLVMSDGRCAVFNEKLMRTAVTEQELEARFLLELDDLPSGAEIHCVQGCGWGVGPMQIGPQRPSDPIPRFSATYDEKGMVDFRETGRASRPSGQ